MLQCVCDNLFDESNKTDSELDTFNDDCDNTITHYYGTLKKISSDDDISYLSRGSVFLLRDDVTKSDSTMHPYLIIQSTYVDKTNKITVLGISSTPATINMVPIVIENSIGYINPNRIYTYKPEEFYHHRTAFKGTIVNSKAFNIAMNLYGMSLGMDLYKTDDEIISDYLSYVDEFIERSKHLDPYQPKSSKYQGKINKLVLHTSFSINNDQEYNDYINPSFEKDDSCKIQATEAIDSIQDTNVEIIDECDDDITTEYDTTKKSLTSKEEVIDLAIQMYQEDKYSINEILEITGISTCTLYHHLNQKNIVRKKYNKKKKSTKKKSQKCIIIKPSDRKTLDKIEQYVLAPSNTVRLSPINKMSDDDKSIFLTCDYLYGAAKTAEIYNTTYSAVIKRKDKLVETHELDYR